MGTVQMKGETMKYAGWIVASMILMVAWYPVTGGEPEGGPPEGLCCVGSSCLILTEAECLDLFGGYAGDNTWCAANSCDQCCTDGVPCVNWTAQAFQQGACCQPDGSCQVIHGDSCLDNGG